MSQLCLHCKVVIQQSKHYKSEESKYAESARNFRQNVQRDLANEELRQNFRGAMDYLMDKRKTALSDQDELETLRQQCKLIKQRCLLKTTSLCLKP